ncbi:MAG: hypothetical protein ACUZ8H_09415 [Candidatus Anammoxibacter sp.]
MNQTITIRLTSKRARLLKNFKKRFNLTKNSEAIDLALGMGTDGEIDYRSRIDKVSGIINLKCKKTSVETIRILKDATIDRLPEQS